MTHLLDTIALERELMQRRLRYFMGGIGERSSTDTGVRCAWDIIEPGNPFESNWHVDAICEHLEAVVDGSIRNLVVTMPPRMLKSVIISVMLPAWVWTFQPSLRWFYGSYDQRLSTRDAVKSRAIIEHPWFQNRWGDRFQLTGDQNVKTFYTNDQGGQRFTTSVSGGATGEGADIIVADDPLNVKHAHRKVVRDAAKAWWTETMPSRLNDLRTGRKIVVMQRIHEDDVAGWCIDHGYTHLNLPMEYEPDRRCSTFWLSDGVQRSWSDPRTQPGQLLFPERVGHDEIAGLGIAPRAYQGQYQQNPLPSDADAMFPYSVWTEYDHLPMGDDGRIQRPDDAFISWDMTFKGKDEAIGPDVDWVVGTFWYRYGADFYLVDMVRGQWGFDDTAKNVRRFDARCRGTRHPFPPLWHTVEDKANGPAILNHLKRTVSGMRPFNPNDYGDKEARAWAAEPDITAGNVLVPRGSIDAAMVPERPGDTAPPIVTMLREFRAFPNGKHDDCVDSVVQAVLAGKARRVIRAV